MTLLELQYRIKQGVESSIPAPVWITAEIGEINIHGSGHCYMDLIDYGTGGGTAQRVEAKARAVVWSSTFRMLKPYFENATGARLVKGLNILVKVQVGFSSIYGLSLSILDIDPSFTVGALEMQRNKTIQRLKAEGCMDMNSQLELPLLPRRLAVISSATAAGYRDFMKHLCNNEYGFRFHATLFQAQMQGEEAPKSIVSALEAIAAQEDAFDAVVIIRGGGAAMDLVCFDDYELAVNIAQFPLPVVTGIGHDHDYHIADMVAHTWLKTPTAVADFFVELFMQQEQYIMHLFQRISLTLTQKISVERERLKRVQDVLGMGVANALLKQKQTLELLQMRVMAADPSKILERGFALATIGGKRAAVNDIVKGSKVRLQLGDGVVEFVVGEVVGRSSAGKE